MEVNENSHFGLIKVRMTQASVLQCINHILSCKGATPRGKENNHFDCSSVSVLVYSAQRLKSFLNVSNQISDLRRWLRSWVCTKFTQIPNLDMLEIANMGGTAQIQLETFTACHVTLYCLVSNKAQRTKTLHIKGAMFCRWADSHSCQWFHSFLIYR